MTEPVEIRVDLPLPLDMSAHLMSAIGAVWPNTMLRADKMASNQLIFVIDPKDRFDGLDDPSRIQQATLTPIEDESLIGALRNMSSDELAVSLPEILAQTLLELSKGFFEHVPDAKNAENYMQFQAIDPEDGKRWTFIAVRGNKPTPHDLRAIADQKADTAERALRDAFTPEALAWLASCPNPDVSAAISDLLTNAATDEQDPE